MLEQSIITSTIHSNSKDSQHLIDLTVISTPTRDSRYFLSVLNAPHANAFSAAATAQTSDLFTALRVDEASWISRDQLYGVFWFCPPEAP